MLANKMPKAPTKQQTSIRPLWRRTEHDRQGTLIQQFPEYFGGIGRFEGKQKITLDPNLPAVVHPPRRVPLSMKDHIAAHLGKEQHYHEDKRRRANSLGGIAWSTVVRATDDCVYVSTPQTWIGLSCENITLPQHWRSYYPSLVEQRHSHWLMPSAATGMSL